ncbi:hypothetical protein CR513_25184, partial [Mucuna pruriens]
VYIMEKREHLEETLKNKNNNPEKHVGKICECFDFNKRMKVKLVSLEFSDYALMWWNEVLCDIRRMRRSIVETWVEFKRDLRERFVSSYHARDLYNKLQRLY